MGIHVIDSKRKIVAGIFNKKHFTLFTWFVLTCCVVIFPIRCDFQPIFINLEFPLRVSFYSWKLGGKETRLNRSGWGSNHTASKNTPIK